MSTRGHNPASIPKSNRQRVYKDDLLLESDHENGSPPDTPRSYTSSDSSSLIGTPRYNLLWDHGYDVDDEASSHCKSPEERALEWRKFNNKTDDDKLQADLHEQARGNTSAMIEPGEEEGNTIGEEDEVCVPSPRLSNDLPDLISSMSGSFSNTFPGFNDHSNFDLSRDPVDGIQIESTKISETCADDIVEKELQGELIYDNDSLEDDVPPPLPDSRPPTLNNSESPPPLPESSPPLLKDVSPVIHIGEVVRKVDVLCVQNEDEGDLDEKNVEFYKDPANNDADVDMDEYNSNVKPEEVVTEIGGHDDEHKAIMPINQDEDCTHRVNEIQTCSGYVALVADRENSKHGTNSQDSVSDMQEHVRQFKALLNLSDGPSYENEQSEQNETKLHSLGTSFTDEHTCTDSAETTDISSVEAQLNQFRDMLDKQMFDKEVEEEFEAIINALDINYMDETYVDRFADRRDRYGFILSPVIEAPSPTPSSTSGYSGLSSASPDPLGMFRMSPRPSSRTDLDLSSLGIVPEDWELNPENTVPIYQQTFRATRAIVIPEKYGWESDDDLLSGSGEWDIGDGSLKTPPISTESVTLSQFGTHVVGWRHPDSVIIEEQEVTSDDENDTDTDETINGEIDNELDVKLGRDDCSYLGPDVADMSDSTISGEEEENDLETVLEKMNDLNKTRVVQDPDTVFDGTHELHDCHDDISHESDDESSIKKGCDDDDSFSVEHNVEKAIYQSNDTDEDLEVCAVKPTQIILCHSRADSNISNQTSEHRSSSDGDEDAEDEMSDSDQSSIDEQRADFNSDKEDIVNKKESLKRSSEEVNNKYEYASEGEVVQVSEIMSPRTAILRAGGMYPMQDDDSSSELTDSDVETDATCENESISEQEKASSVTLDTMILNEQSVDPDVQVTQYTSDDSDISRHSTTTSKASMQQNTSNIQVSFRGKYNVGKQGESSPKNDNESPILESVSASSTPVLSIISPIDFSIFGDKLDRSTTQEGGRSPRVLGRYYSEMDEDILTKSLSPPAEDVKIHHLFPATSEDVIPFVCREVTPDEELSFKNVDFTLSTATALEANRKGLHGAENDDLDSSNNSHESVANVEDNVNQGNDDNHSASSAGESFEMIEKQRDQSPVSDIDITEIDWEHPVETKLPTPKQGKQKTPPVTKALHRKHAKAQRRSPVQIKVSPLKRKDSTRNATKKGFVQQLSEMFGNKQSYSKREQESLIPKKKSREPDSARVILTERLSPKENIIFDSSPIRVSELTMNEATKGDSLGFDLYTENVPMPYIEEIKTVSDAKGESGSDDQRQCKERIYQLDIEDEVNDDSDVKIYEERLRELEEIGDQTQDIQEDAHTMTPNTDVKDMSSEPHQTNDKLKMIQQTLPMVIDETSCKVNDTVDLRAPVTNDSNDPRALVTNDTVDPRAPVTNDTVDPRAPLTNDSNDPRALVMNDTVDPRAPVTNDTVDVRAPVTSKHTEEEKAMDEYISYETNKDTDIVQSSDHSMEPDKGDCTLDNNDGINEYYDKMKLFKRWISKPALDTQKSELTTQARESYLSYVRHPNSRYYQSHSSSENDQRAIDANDHLFNETDRNVYSKTNDVIAVPKPQTQNQSANEVPLVNGEATIRSQQSALPANHCIISDHRRIDLDSMGAETPESYDDQDESHAESSSVLQTPVSSRKRSFLKERKEMLSKLDLPNGSEKIQYPPSLSLRLYGPYTRQMQRNHASLDDSESKPGHNAALNDIEQREKTRPTLKPARTSPWSLGKPDTCQITDAVNTGNVSETRKRTDRPLCASLSRKKTLGDPWVNDQNPTTPHREIICNDANADEWIDYELSQLDVDNNPVPMVNIGDVGLSADIFQHTLYEVRTPVPRSPSMKDDVPPAYLNPITSSTSNETERLYHRGNDFTNANIRSTVWPRAVNTDAGRDKLQPDFPESQCLNEIRRGVSPVNQRVDNSYSVCDTEHVHGVLTCLGDESIKGGLTNGILQQKMGVFPAMENSVSDDTPSRVKMKENGPSNQATSVEGKVSSLGINDSTSAETAAVNQASMSTGEDSSRQGLSQGKEGERAVRNVPGAWTPGDKHVSVVVLPPDCEHVLEDEKGNLRIWPYSEFENSDKLPVTLHTVKRRVKLRSAIEGMIGTNSSSNMMVIQAAQHSTEMPENKMMKKYHSSSVMPADHSGTNIMHTHSDTVQKVLLQDANGNMVSEEELSKILPKIADLVARMDTSDAEEILPGITQSVTKLRNGGNLVITTMTRKVDEVESESSSGRGSPAPSHPVLDVDDLEGSKIYLVEDSKGEMFYVEDITNDSQESAYYSSSRNTSESISDGANSPSFKRISKINQLGDSGIQNSTAEEILSAMYNDGTVHEMNENEEEWSERTYEYEIPRRRQVEPTKGYSKDSFNTSYVVEEPETIPRTKTTTKDRFETSYEMSENQPWVADGGQMQSYSEATQVHGVDRTDGASTVSNVDGYTYGMANNGRQVVGYNPSGYTNTHESYTIDAEALVYPMVPFQYPVPAPLPVYMPPPPVCIPEENPQYSLVKVKITPPQSEESVSSVVDVTQHSKTIEIDERPIYKTVAHIQTGEKPPPVKTEMSKPKRTYRVVSTKASPAKEEEQESHMSFGELDYRYTTENVEVKQSPSLQTKQFFVRDSAHLEKQQQQHKRIDNEQRFRSERKLELSTRGSEANRSSNKTTIDVRPAVTNNYSGNDMETYEERSYSFDQMKTSVEPVFPDTGDMRVIRGSYLIKNNLDEVDGELDDNINMFDGNFVLSKENPLYQSDEDLYRKFDREKAEHAQKQDRFQRDYRQDLTFETVDKFSKSKNIKREEAKPKQSITEILLSKLSTVDSKDIRQKIDVKHHAEDIYGDPRFLHADGVSVKSQGTNDFDTVGEKVDLLLKEGKAYITVKVTAERITPVDMEFNVWRKNQAIVTRTIEVDLLATEQRRRLYYKVMEEQGSSNSGRRDWRAGPNETILDGHQTLELFSRILGAADGEGDKEDITVKTRMANTTRPFTSGMDLLY